MVMTSCEMNLCSLVFLKSSFFSDFFEYFLSGRDLYPGGSQTVAGNFPPKGIPSPGGGRGGRCSGEFPLGAQTHVPFPPQYPKEPLLLGDDASGMDVRRHWVAHGLIRDSETCLITS